MQQDPTAGTAPHLRQSWTIIVALGITQIVGYGTVFYSFSLLMEPLQLALGATKGTVVGAFSIALVVAGLCAAHIGSTIDRIGGRLVMTLGSIAAWLLLSALSRVESIAGLYVIYAGLGAAMAAILYEPAFAVLARIFRANARRAITRLTLIAGFASTVFWPLTQALIQHLGWRDSLLILGVLNLLVCVPLHLLFLPARGATVPAAVARSAQSNSKSLREVLREPAFYFLGGTFVANGLIFSALSVHMLPMMQARGLSPAAAALVGALVGPMQFVGRILELTLGQRVSIARVGLLALSLLVLAFIVFSLSGANVWLLMVFTLLYGAGNGVVTIVRGAMPAVLFGPDHYGAVSGALAMPQMFALASGPFVVSLLWMASGGYDAVPFVLAGVMIAGLASFYAALRVHRHAG